MSLPETLQDMSNVTFSQALAVGHTHSGWLAGPTTDPSGQALAHASHSVSPAVAKELTAIATFGPLSGGLLPSVGQQKSLENRLQMALPVNGSTAWHLTWNVWTTFSGRRISRLVPWGHTTSECERSLRLPTPNARDGKDVSTTTAYLSARARHTPSLATHLIGSGVSWRAVPMGYCWAMGYPSRWQEMLSKGMATQSCRKSRQSSSGQQ